MAEQDKAARAAAETALAETAAAATVPAAAGDEPFARGSAVGRYVVLDRIGAGAMGVVYAARDRDLDRNIALKLVRDPKRSAARRRFLREAQALAQLSHPNVVAVFDVGTFRDQVFLAMELVAGKTLRSWLAGRPRTWREVVEVYRRAGEGLAAAHAAGVVHRDFKPDNVLIDESGRVRVADFGLALVDRGEGDEDDGEGRGRVDAPSLTATGAVLGTPAYMAPEQRSGCAPVDARADQFSFCVALYEALCGMRPFELEGAGERATESPFADELGTVVRGEQVPGAAAARKLPARLRRLLARGLATDPDDRYPSMDALLADLGHEPRVRRRVAVAGGAAVLAAAALVFGTSLAGRDEPICRGAAEKLAGAWDGARKRAVQSAFRASRSPLAQSAWPRVEQAIDRWASGWVSMHTEACEATNVRGEQSASLLDLRMECLDRRRTELRALVDRLSAAAGDAATIERSIQAAQSLPPLGQCADGRALSEEVREPADPTSRARVAALRTRLAEVKAQSLTGHSETALGLARQLAADAGALGHRPLEAEVLTALAELENRNGYLAAAEEALYRAVAAGQAGRAARLTAEAWLDLGWVVGVQRERREEGHRLASLARGALERLGSDRLLESTLEGLIGNLYADEGKLPEARRHLEQALALAEQAGARGFDLAIVVQHLAMLADFERNYPEELRLYHRARTLVEDELGPDHPAVIDLLTGEGGALMDMERLDESLALSRRGLALVEKTRGPVNEAAAAFLTNIGLVKKEQGDYRGALADFDRALAVTRQVFGPEHSLVGNVHVNIAIALTKMERFPEALAAYRRAMAIYEREGPDEGAHALAGIGEVHIEAGHPALALAPLERALDIYVRAEVPDLDLGIVRELLARALWASGRDRPRARKLAETARASFERAGDDKKAAELAAWLTQLR